MRATEIAVQDGDALRVVRPEVAEFAAAMEAKLRKNDHKTGWHDQPIEAHIKLLRIEMMELDVALDHLGDEAAVNECIDVANFALIIRDKLLARIKAKQELRPPVTCGACGFTFPWPGPFECVRGSDCPTVILL